jgi:hypothetical protein
LTLVLGGWSASANRLTEAAAQGDIGTDNLDLESYAADFGCASCSATATPSTPAASMREGHTNPPIVELRG